MRLIMGTILLYFASELQPDDDQTARIFNLTMLVDDLWITRDSPVIGTYPDSIAAKMTDALELIAR